jgi:hypothetical protein
MPAIIAAIVRLLICFMHACFEDAILPKNVPKLSVEAAVTMGWGEWAQACLTC